MSASPKLTREEAIARRAAGHRAKLDAEVACMYADYQRPLSLSAVAKRYGRSRKCINNLFECRGLAVRVSKTVPKHRLPNGRIAPVVPFTSQQIAQLVAQAKRVEVPKPLKHEWRSWSLERRGQFIRQVREALNSSHDRPDLPFSEGLTPFDYDSPQAHEISRLVNLGKDSRSALLKLKVSSQGVIWRGRLWFWSYKIGYHSGQWTREHGLQILHHVIWEEHHKQSVPSGHVVRFIDKNPNNLLPDNLTLATRNDVARENQAVALFKQSRELTALLLDRAQCKNSTNDQHDTLTLLRRPGC